MLKSSIRLLLLVVLAGTAHGTQGGKEEVELRFEDFLKAKNNFAESITEFYNDDAQIEHFEHMPDGFLKENYLTGKQYKHILRKIRLMAKANNDVWEFQNLNFNMIGDEVHVTGTRFSHLRNCKVPYESHWAKDLEGNWKIVYEYLKTVPIPENL